MTDQRTIDTYNDSAKALADYFRGIGPRVEDINLAIELAGGAANFKVVEIGCGDGRDAKDIVTKVGSYCGYDISEELIKIAKKTVPNATFEVADAVGYNYPKNLDIVFAFASLLHLNEDEVRSTLMDVHGALRPGGIFFISLKERSTYTEEIKNDQYGSRLFYFYNSEIITALAGKGYQKVASSRKCIGKTDWFEIALRKI